jgi:hypothetical protein
VKAVGCLAGLFQSHKSYSIGSAGTMGNLQASSTNNSLVAVFHPPPGDNLSTARNKLRSSKMYLSDLPRELIHPAWDEVMKKPFSLTLPEMMALRRYVLDPSVADFCSGSDNFSRSQVSELKNCLNSVRTVSLTEALISADTAFIKGLADPPTNTLKELMERAIENNRGKISEVVHRTSVTEDLLLAARLYTLNKSKDDQISLYEPMNRELNSPTRSSSQILANYYLYMKLLIMGLRRYGDAGNYKIAMAYRGLRVEGNNDLQTKYDHYSAIFGKKSWMTMAAFTSVSLNRSVAESFCDKLMHEQENLLVFSKWVQYTR